MPSSATAIAELEVMGEALPLRQSEPAATQANRLAYIDALRGLACLWVIYCHVHGYWLDSVRERGWDLTTFVTRVAGYGGKGVDLFIVLSGFCLYWPLVRKGGDAADLNIREFCRRRARRILPAYYGALALCTALVLVPALQPKLVSRPIEWWDAISHLFLVQTWSPHTIASINGSFWSLALEMQLYFAFPLLLLIGRRFGMWGVFGTGLVVATVWQCFWWWFDHRHSGSAWRGLAAPHLPARWMEFICGMAAAALVARPRPGQLKWAAVLLAVFVPIGIIDHPLGMRGGAFSHMIWGIVFGSALVILAELPAKHFISWGRLGVLTWIGTISYSLYLLQQPYLLLTAGWAKSLGLSTLGTFGFFAVAGLPPLIGLTYVFFRVFERPFLRQV